MQLQVKRKHGHLVLPTVGRWTSGTPCPRPPNSLFAACPQDPFLREESSGAPSTACPPGPLPASVRLASPPLAGGTVASAAAPDPAGATLLRRRSVTPAHAPRPRVWGSVSRRRRWPTAPARRARRGRAAGLGAPQRNWFLLGLGRRRPGSLAHGAPVRRSAGRRVLGMEHIRTTKVVGRGRSVCRRPGLTGRRRGTGRARLACRRLRTGRAGPGPRPEGPGPACLGGAGGVWAGGQGGGLLHPRERGLAVSPVEGR